MFASLSLCCADEWTGTGFALNQGYVVTNYHVAAGAEKIEIRGIKGDLTVSYSAKVIATDKKIDIAILKVDDSKFTGFGAIPYKFRFSTLDVGESVWALGYPMTEFMGNEIKFTDGKISSKTGFQGDVSQYQISVPIQPGNSGGPLFDASGNIVGITSSGLNREVLHTENVNYAIKSSYVKNLLESSIGSGILPQGTQMQGRSLTESIKLAKNFVFFIQCKDSKTSPSGSQGTKPTDPGVMPLPESGFRAVDLGLSVKWASCNLGADKPYEAGDYLAWGELQPKSMYSRDTYKFCDRSSGKAEYIPMKKIFLQDDAAQQRLGGSWHIPTVKEFRELLTKCRIDEVYLNVDGTQLLCYKFTGPNGNWIILPALGFRVLDRIDYYGDKPSYQTSESEYGGGEYQVLGKYTDGSIDIINSGWRSQGFQIRPVCY